MLYVRERRRWVWLAPGNASVDATVDTGGDTPAVDSVPESAADSHATMALSTPTAKPCWATGNLIS